MMTSKLALCATLLAVAACSGGGGGDHAPLLTDLGNGGTTSDAAVGGSASGDGGHGQGGLGAGGAGQSAGGTGSGGTSADGGTSGDGGAAGGGAGGAASGGSDDGAGGIGVSGGGTDGGAAAQCTLSSGLEGCDSCVQRHCNEPCLTCQGNSECNAILECILTNCFDKNGVINQQCAGNCTDLHPNGKTAFDGFIVNPDSCARSYCSGFCSFF